MYEQYVNSFFVPYTINSYDVTVYTQEKKKRVLKTRRGFGNADPNPHLIVNAIYFSYLY